MQRYFIKTISKVLRNHTIDRKARLMYFNCVDSSVTDQETILLRKAHPDTHEPATVFASIECFKRNRTSRILSGQVTFFRQFVQGQEQHLRISTPLG